jgi:hypothetical protein
VSVDGSEQTQTRITSPIRRTATPGRNKVYLALDAWSGAAARIGDLDRGIRTTGDLVDEEIRRATSSSPVSASTTRGNSSTTSRASRFLQHQEGQGLRHSLNLSMGAYRGEQSRACRPTLMNRLIADLGAGLARRGSLRLPLQRNNTVTYDVVSSTPHNIGRRCGSPMPTSSAHRRPRSDVRNRYKADERTYKSPRAVQGSRDLHSKRAVPRRRSLRRQKPDDKKVDDKKVDDKKVDDKKVDDQSPTTRGRREADDKNPACKGRRREENDKPTQETRRQEVDARPTKATTRRPMRRPTRSRRQEVDAKADKKPTTEADKVADRRMTRSRPRCLPSRSVFRSTRRR